MFASASAIVAEVTPAASCASTYDFTAFTLGYLESDAPSVLTLVLLLAEFSFKANPGTVGAAAVPARSPANCIFPFELAFASAIVAPDTCASTYVLTAFTLGYLVSNAASVVTFKLLFDLSSFVASAVFTSDVFAFNASAVFTSDVFALIASALFTSAATARVDKS